MDSFIAWIGGKKLLRKQIIAEFPKEYERYIEVFGGAGWVMFGLDNIPNLEVFNDINKDLINLYRCIKYHPQELQKELQFATVSRELFNNYKSQLNVDGLTDIQRAARYFIVIKTSFGGNREHFWCSKKNLFSGVEYFSDIHIRLKKTVIENKDFEGIIKTYDRDNALFYCDPPYFGTEKYYKDDFRDKHISLFNALSKIKGKFILSYNDCEYIRNLYREYNIISVDRSNNLKTKNGIAGKYSELIIKNY